MIYSGQGGTPPLPCPVLIGGDSMKVALLSFSDDLAAAKAAVLPHQDVDVLLNGNLHTLRFHKMDAVEWAEATASHPARPNVLIDTRYGYNLRAVTRTVAPQTGFLLDGDRPTPLQSEDEWVSLFKAISGAEFARIMDAVWELNEYGPQEAVKAAKKALAISGKNSS